MLALVLGAVLQDAPFVKAGGVVPVPKRIHYVEPRYPDVARQVGLEGGVIVLEVGLAEDGHPIDIKVLRGTPILDVAAIEAVKQWRYEPTILAGEPIRIAVQEIVDVFSSPESRARYSWEILRSTKQPKALRLLAVRRLHSIGGKILFVTDALRKATQDADPEISSAAANALKALK